MGLVDAQGRDVPQRPTHLYVVGLSAVALPFSPDDLLEIQGRAVAAGAPATVHEMVTYVHASLHLSHHDGELDKLAKRCARLERIIDALMESADLDEVRSRLDDEVRITDPRLEYAPMERPDTSKLEAAIAQALAFEGKTQA